MLLRILSILNLFVCSTCFSHESTETDDTLLNKILANQSKCVVSVIDNKIYVNPERIFPTEQGIFLNVNEGEYITIPILYSDAQGCYVQQIFDRSVTKACPFCGWERVSNAIKCKNPACLSNQPKKKKN